jgi:hypothetical protein
MSEVFMTQEQYDIIRMRAEQYKDDTDTFKYYVEGDFEIYDEDTKLKNLSGYAVALAWLNPELVSIHKKVEHSNYEKIVINEVIERFKEGKLSYYKNAFEQYVIISRTFTLETLISFSNQLYKTE